MKRFAKLIAALVSRPTTGSPKERVVRTNINGKSYSISSDDDYLDHVEGDFEPEMVSLFKSLLQPHDTVLDIGANIGCTSLLFGALARKVYSFEPSPSTYRWLVQNVQSAKLTNVEPVNLGLGKDAGTCRTLVGAVQLLHQVVTVKDVVTQHQGTGIIAYKVAPNDEGLRQAVRTGLNGILDVHTQKGTVTQQFGKTRRVLRRADEQHIPNAAEH